MKRFVLTAAILAAMGACIPVTFSTAASANEVAGRPALPTTSVADLFKLRETWGTKPSGKK